MYLHVKLLSTSAKLPTRGINPSNGDIDSDAVGYDLYAPEDGFLDPLERKLVKLGLATEFSPGYVGKIFDRSGMGNKGLTTFAGVIDPSYRGEWGVILYNSSRTVFRWAAGDRLAQVVFFKVELPIVYEVAELSPSARGLGGYGSTGK